MDPSTIALQSNTHFSNVSTPTDIDGSFQRPLPIKKIISKKDIPKKNSRRILRIRAQHSKINTDLNYNSKRIQDTTQQAQNSSSFFKQGRESEPRDQSPINLDQSLHDENSNLNTQRVFEFKPYLNSILAHALDRETAHTPKEISDKENISENSRTRMVSWIFDLSSRFGFKEETAYCAVNIVDKTLGLKRILLDRLPLLGVTALFMATKYQEILIPQLSNFVAVVPLQYKVTKEQVLNLESSLLNIFNFDLGYVCPLFYIHHCDLESSIHPEIKSRAILVSKQLLLSPKYHYWPSSKLAIKAIQIAESELLALSSTTIFDSINSQSMLRA